MPIGSSVLTLPILQEIVAQMAASCGFADESPADLLLLLTEELGELARAVRRESGLAAAPDTASANVADELADCAILLLRMADAYGVDLGQAVLAKCEANERRYS